jgi:CheY-like chemotaxis protein
MSCRILQMNVPVARQQPIFPRQTMQPILIVDDEKTNHALVCRAFTKNKIGNPLVFFLDGHKLMDYLTHMHHNRYLPPAFILLDLNMADMHGKKVIQALRQHPLFGCIPVIVFSSEGNAGEGGQCRPNVQNTSLKMCSRTTAFKNP